MKHCNAIKGFVFIELVVVLGILSALLGIVIVNVGNIQNATSVSTTVTTFITDLKNQQTKAMVGDTEGRGIPDVYSVYIEPGGYTMFHGENYNSSDGTNFTVPIKSPFQLLTTFPSGKIVFASGSGELLQYSSASASVTIRNTMTNEQKTIQLNKYGTVVSVQ